MTSNRTFVYAIYWAIAVGILQCHILLGSAQEFGLVVVPAGDDAILLVPQISGILSVTWQAPDGAIIGQWTVGKNGESLGVANSHVPHYSGRVNVTKMQMEIASAQPDDTGNYTLTVVNRVSSSSSITSLLLGLIVLEDSSGKSSISERLTAANSGLDDISYPPMDLRNADPCVAKGCTWKKSSDGNVYIPYVLSNEYSPFERNVIERAMRSMQSSTCIRFRPRQSERDFLGIYSRSGCSSFVGRRGGEQVVSLRRQGCLYIGTIQHEFLHALGFWHEHQRSDRDNHVRVLLQNVETGKEHNFDTVETLNQNTPYDYSSIMHYTRVAFSKNGQATLVPIPDSSVPIGTALSMSRNDITRINRLYKCDQILVRVSVLSTAIEGESVTLECTWSGAQTSVTWRKNGLTLSQDSRMTMVEGLLIINQLQRDDEGQYSCTVVTDDTTDTSTAKLTVYYKCLTLGGLIGVVIACAIVLCALCIAIVLLVQRRKAQRSIHTAYSVNIKNPNFPYSGS